MLEQIIFYAFSALVVAAGAMVITLRNPVHAVLCLVVAFFASAGLWMLLEAEFLAITLVLVYVGAVMVLFMFVVMMLDINLAVLREGFAGYVPVALVFAVLMMVSIALVVGPKHFGLALFAAPLPHAADYNNTLALGRSLFAQFLLPFEAAAVVLLVAIIAAIALTLRPSRQTKAPKPERQVQVRRADRVRLVKDMDAEGTP
ncbi:MAG: NADH-quinone oxidoreductase subunit J [Gammaproteobacteria bacterium]|nr:NADH-quinone oxidoreductase subunit J [Gammaproteobacteria bacterium]